MPSIEKRGERSWRLIVEDPSSSLRNRKQEKKTIRITDNALLNAPTKLQAYLNLELAKFQMEVESGKYIKAERMTFKDFVKEWHKNFAKQGLGGFTLKNYNSIIDSQLTPYFGNMEIGKIKTITIVKYFTQLRTPEGRKDGKEKPLSTNTLKNIYTVLKSIFDKAEEWRFISNNPMDGVQRPVADKKEKREMKQRKKSFTPDEARQVLLVLSELTEHWSLYFIGVLIGGFRRGEMLGVEWHCVDFVRGGIYIEKQITFDEFGNTVEGEVKTVESEAFVPMPKFYMNALEIYKKNWDKQKEDAGELWLGGDKQYLFHSGFGAKYYPDTPTGYWTKLRAKKNFPNIRLHDLRHTTAMLLREDHVDMKSIQERLRHSRMETTTLFYTEESDDISRYTADILEKYDPSKL